MSYIHTKGEAKKRKLPSYLSVEEFSSIVKIVKKKHHKLAFFLGFGSGMRVSEIVNLKKEYIDFDKKRIHIKNSKWGKDRVVPLPKGFPKEYLKYIPLKIGVRALQKAFKKYVEQAGIKKSNIHFHSLRHSFAIHCMEQGIPLNQIQILLGHENISTTSIYLRINPQDALKSYEKLF